MTEGGCGVAPQVGGTHPGFGARFRAAAKGWRGIVAWVVRQGGFALGDELRLHVPEQRVRAHLAKALSGKGYSRKSLAARLAMFSTKMAKSACRSPLLSP